MGTVFVAGIYGVGKSTLCNNLSDALCIPYFSASDLISSINGEKYGANKKVANKYNNQDILSYEVRKQLQISSRIILAGHFCIFNNEYGVDCLQDSIYSKLNIESILLLEADINIVLGNLNKRDKITYDYDQLAALALEEKKSAQRVAEKIECNLFVHRMNFNNKDIDECISYIDEGRDNK
jgi:adenylate kinase